MKKDAMHEALMRLAKDGSAEGMGRKRGGMLISLTVAPNSSEDEEEEEEDEDTL